LHLENRPRIIANQKQNYDDNREAILEKCKIFYNNNKESCQTWKNGKTMCKCGKEYTNANKARHERSQYHQDNTLD
jgi:hypothetical protein